MAGHNQSLVTLKYYPMANRQKTLKISMIPDQILMKFLKFWQIKPR